MNVVIDRVQETPEKKQSCKYGHLFSLSEEVPDSDRGKRQGEVGKLREDGVEKIAELPGRAFGGRKNPDPVLLSRKMPEEPLEIQGVSPVHDRLLRCTKGEVQVKGETGKEHRHEPEQSPPRFRREPACGKIKVEKSGRKEYGCHMVGERESEHEREPVPVRVFAQAGHAGIGPAEVRRDCLR